MRLAELRKSKNISQKQLADMLHVGRTTITMWESKSSPTQPDSSTLQKLADIFGVSIDYLLDYEAPVCESRESVSAKPVVSEAALELAQRIDALSDRDRELIRELTASMVRLAEREQDGH